MAFSPLAFAKPALGAQNLKDWEMGACARR
jgi:hypothetical protein